MSSLSLSRLTLRYVALLSFFVSGLCFSCLDVTCLLVPCLSLPCTRPIPNLTPNRQSHPNPYEHLHPTPKSNQPDHLGKKTLLGSVNLRSQDQNNVFHTTLEYDPLWYIFCPWDQNILSHDIYGWLLETQSFAVSVFGLATKKIIFVSLWDRLKTNINLSWDKFVVGLWTKNLGKKLGRMFGICLKTIIYPFLDNK